MSLSNRLQPSRDDSWRKALLLRGPRGLAALTRLTGSFNIHELVARHAQAYPPVVVLGDTFNKMGPIRKPSTPSPDSHPAAVPADDSGTDREPWQASRLQHQGIASTAQTTSPTEPPPRSTCNIRINEAYPGILSDPEWLTYTTLTAISDWPWNPLGQGARPYLFLESDNLDHAAQDLIEAPAARSWWEALPKNEQIMLGSGERQPDVQRLARRVEVYLEESSWRLPWGLTTSNKIGPRLPAARLCDDEAVYGLDEPISCWRLPVDSDARVYEINVPSDWIALCETYPKLIHIPPEWTRWGVDAVRGLCADWLAVACDWDALHISMAGLLTTVGLPLGIGAYGSIFEDEIGSELTVWFRPCFGEPSFITTFEGYEPPI